MSNSKHQKGKLLWGSFLLCNLFIGIPLIVLQLIGLEALVKFMPGIAKYNEWILLIIIIPWLALTRITIVLGRKMGPLIMRRFYTREEMYEILAGPLGPRPLNARRENSINRQLEYLYK